MATLREIWDGVDLYGTSMLSERGTVVVDDAAEAADPLASPDREYQMG